MVRLPNRVAYLFLAAAMCVSCSTGPSGAVGERVDLPNDHPAALVLARADTYDQFAELAAERELEFVCGGGGGPAPWEVCMVLGNDILAVVPFDVRPGLTGVVKSAALNRGVSLPLDQGAVGIMGVEQGVDLVLRWQGKTIGSIGGPFTPPQGAP